MQNTMTYQSENFRENTTLLRVHEKPANYVELLDAKIEKYISQLKGYELRCARPGVDREKLLDEITLLNDSMLEACAQFEKNVNDADVVKAAQLSFREKTNPILSKSYMINRCRTWPQGHQGDYMMLELGYRNTPLSDGIGYYLDRYFLSAPLAVAARERLTKLRELLQEELRSTSAPKVLDVACGSCREVFELSQEIKASRARFMCLDLDRDALDFARDRFSNAGLLSDNVELLTYNALRMFDYETAKTEFGMQDIIYSVGFFDYLPDDFLVKLLRSLYLLLNPGGKLIAAFKDANRYRSQIYHWLVDWDDFLQRTETDFENLLRQADIPGRALSMTRVESGLIIFYTITKE